MVEKLNEKIEIDNDYLYNCEKSRGYFFLKRLMDLLGALCGIVFFSLVIIIIALTIKLDSSGPIIFGHKRLGRNGKVMKVYKFRTMLSNAEELLKNLTPEQEKEFKQNFKLEKDPRITRLGSFLRKCSLDELPQLFNIFLGNMSIVGPRPIVESELEKYGNFGNKLLSVKPGLTGLWQVSGRSDTTYEERVKLDIEYIDKRSFWVDLKIIFKTVVVVLKKEGAK